MRSFNAQTHELVSRGQSCLPRALRVTYRRSWATWSSQTLLLVELAMLLTDFKLRTPYSPVGAALLTVGSVW